MEVTTVRFGKVTINDDTVIDIKGTIIGFEDLSKFVLLQSDNSMLAWLQSTEDPAIAFVVTNPFIVYSDYDFELNDEETRRLEIIDPQDITVLCIVSVPEQIHSMTLNLLAPIVINNKNNMAGQVILNSSQYQTKHLFYDELCRSVKKETVAA